MKARILSFCKKEAVLVISAALALISVFFGAPARAYAGYIDFRTLMLLFCLMLVTAGMQAQGVFSRLGGALLRRAHTARALALVLVLLCFFSSMLITNDVALITFVPFAILVLRMSGLERQIIGVVVLQTIAANLGSMLTPIGNPQNLYLYAAAGMSAGELMLLMLPYCALALGVLCLCCLFFPRRPLTQTDSAEDVPPLSARIVALYALLFVLCLLTVLHLLPIAATFVASVLAVLVFDRRRIGKVDYSLLLTFTALFVFIGNLGDIPPVRDFLTRTVAGRETPIGVAASQIFSNVPAAILLSGFSSDLRALIVGVNLGGLGTMIASMASLISFRAYTVRLGQRGKYLAVFTAANLTFLALELLLWWFVR